MTQIPTFKRMFSSDSPVVSEDVIVLLTPRTEEHVEKSQNPHVLPLVLNEDMLADYIPGSNTPKAPGWRHIEDL